ncbi:MAG: TRAP transporter large permease, partial [Desulfovibrio sp.]
LSSMISLMIFSNTNMMVLVQKTFSGLDSFTLLAIPLFILAGNVMSAGGVSRRLVNLASCGFGHYRGGLSQVLTAACTFFGAISGSAPATAAAIGTVMFRPMADRGYPIKFVGSCIAASGVIGLLIPPSVTMIVYGVITGASIGKLFLAGILPGLVMSAVIMLGNWIMARRTNCGREPRVSSAEKRKAFRDAIWALAMPIIILGGIYGGIFTPTESAIVAAVYGMLVGKFIYKELTLPGLLKQIKATARNSATLMFLVATAQCFSYFMASEQIPETLARFLLSLSQQPTVVIMLMCLVMLIVGTFLDNVIAMLLLAPIFYPIIVQLGIDPVYFGIIMVLTLSIGQITPPVGTTLFVACNISGLSLEDLSSGIWLYLIMMLIALCIIILVPDIVTFIPNMM